MAKDDLNPATGGRDRNRDDMDERGIGSADDTRGIANEEGDDEFEDTDDLDEDEDFEEDEGVR